MLPSSNCHLFRSQRYPLGRVELFQLSPRSRRPLLTQLGSDVVQRAGLNLSHRLRRQCRQFLGLSPIAVFLLWAYRNLTPAAESRVNSLTMRRADIVAVRRLGRPAFQDSVTLGVVQTIRCLIELVINLAKSLPYRIVCLVPAELMRIDEPTRSNRSDNDPGQESILAGRASSSESTPNCHCLRN